MSHDGLTTKINLISHEGLQKIYNNLIFYQLNFETVEALTFSISSILYSDEPQIIKKNVDKR